MNRMLSHGLRLLVLAALLPALPTAAQRVDPTRVLDVTVQLPDQIMSASIREGGSLNLRLLSTNEEFDLVAVAQGRDTRGATIAVYRVTPGPPPTRRIVERVSLTPGVPAALRNGGITVVLDRVRTVTTASRTSLHAAPPLPSRWASLQENCCVCCGGVCACACAVKMSCGSCAMPGCQITETSTPSGREGDEARLAAVLGLGGCARPFPSTTARLAVR